MTATMAGPACPKCQGEMYDNRATKKNPAQPDYKCKAYKSGCEGVIWPPKGGVAAPAPAAAPVARPAAPVAQAYVGNLPGDPGAPASFMALASVYEATLIHVLANVVPTFVSRGIPITLEGVSAVTATLFIARTKAGV
jgi:hypothetical protein